MTNRRGFLQKIAALSGSTMLPGSTVGGVIPLYSPQVAATAAAITATGVATVAAVARRVKTSGALIDAATFERKTWVAIINPDGSVFEKEMMYSEILDDPARRAEAEELDKLYPNVHHGRRWSVLATRIILEKQGMPPLTPEEEIMIIEGKKENTNEMV